MLSSPGIEKMPQSNVKHPHCIIVGSRGLIGKALINAWNPSIATDYKDSFHLLNLKSPSLESFPITNETHLIIAAGQTKPAICEAMPKETYAANVEGTLTLAKLAVKREMTPILFSTDYVFDGTLGRYYESSPHCPLNEYGRQKALLEENIADITGGNYLLLRLSKIFTTTPRDCSLLDEIFSKLQTSPSFLAATDQIFNPLHIDDLIKVIEALIEKKKTGIYNVGGKEPVSRYDLATMVCESLNLSKTRITPVSIDTFGKNLRPKKTILETTKLYSEIKVNPTPLFDRIRDLSLFYKG